MNTNESSKQTTEQTLLELIKRNNVTVMNILQLKSVVEQLQRDSSQFTKHFIKRQNIVLDCFDIALRPKIFMKKTGISLTFEMTHRCIQILSNQYEQFVDWVMNFTRTDIQTNQIRLPMFDSIFRILWDPQPLEETPVTYLAKILNPFLYQKTTEIIQYFIKYKNIPILLCSHFYNKAISEIFIRLLESENQNQFFQDQKLEFLNILLEAMFQQQYEHFLEPILQNFANLLKGMFQKLDDRYDKQKYASLMRKFLSNSPLMKILVEHINKRIHNDEIFYHGLCIIGAILKFDTNTTACKINSCNSSGQTLIIHLQDELLSYAINFIYEIGSIVTPQTGKKQLIQFYKMVKYIIMIKQQSQVVNKIINIHFLITLFKLIQFNPRNNILHNVLKDLILTYIANSNKYKLILTPQVGFMKLVYSLKPGNSPIYQYQIQIYQIVLSLLNRLENQPDKNQQTHDLINTLEEGIQVKKKFYSVKICEQSLSLSVDWAKQSDQLFSKLDDEVEISLNSPGIDMNTQSQSFFRRAKDAKSSDNLSLEDKESWKNVDISDDSLPMEIQQIKTQEEEQIKNEKFLKRRVSSNEIKKPLEETFMDKKQQNFVDKQIELFQKNNNNQASNNNLIIENNNKLMDNTQLRTQKL